MAIESLFALARQPIYDKWLEIAQLARQRGEINVDYLGEIDAFILQFAA